MNCDNNEMTQEYKSHINEKRLNDALLHLKFITFSACKKFLIAHLFIALVTHKVHFSCESCLNAFNMYNYFVNYLS